MTDYTLRPLRPDDYQVFYKGAAVGRIYSDILGGKTRWIWNIYINHNAQPAEGVALKGYVDSLDEAKGTFRKGFGALIAAGKVSLK